MKIKRFFARDMRQAIRLVREELGPDAVILSNRRVEGGVEIVSAVDYDEALLGEAQVAASPRSVSGKTVVNQPTVREMSTSSNSGSRP